MPRRSTYISVQPFIDRLYELQRMGVTTSIICRRLGWEESRIRDQRNFKLAETSRLMRTLGLQKAQTYHIMADGAKRIYTYYPQTKPDKELTPQTAKQLCDAMDIPYSDVGL